MNRQIVGKSKRLAMYAAVLGAVLVQAPAIAREKGEQKADPVLSDPVLVAAVAEAESRGQQLHKFDQAAWHATDALFARVKPDEIEGGRGYVVVPRENDPMLDTIFVVERDGELRQFARYTVDGSKVVSGGLLEGDLPRLDPVAARMFEAREPAIEAMRRAEFGLCSRSNPNTLVLPPDDQGNVAFYLLTSTTSNDIYPMGGHYRADVSPEGKAVSTRRYMKSCYDLPRVTPPGPDGQPGHAGVTYLLGDAPSEIHVFVGYHMPNGFMVITTSNEKLWLVQDGKITLKQEGFDLPGQ